MTISICDSLGGSVFTAEVEFEFNPARVAIRDNKRTLGGSYLQYTHAIYERFEIPLTYVNTAFQAALSTWWENSTEISLIVDTSSYTGLRIANLEQPCTRPVRPYNFYFSGTLVLEGDAV